MARVRLPIVKRSWTLSSADPDTTSGSSKTSKSPSLRSKKRKITEEHRHPGFIFYDDLHCKVADSFEVPPDLYLFIREAVVLMDRLKTNSNDMDAISGLESAETIIRNFAEYLKKLNELPDNWQYDPSAAKTYKVLYCPSKTQHLPDDLPKGRDRCCAPFLFPLDRYAKTDDVPLMSRKDKEIWKEFREFDKKFPGLTAIHLHDFEKEKIPIKIDNPIVSLAGNFAIAAFNKAIQKYVKPDSHRNLHAFKIMECAYIKLRQSGYYFYLTIEAIEEGKLGVYETKVRLEWEDGRKSLCTFVLTDRTPRGERKRVKRIRDPVILMDPTLDKLTGMKRRSKSASCMGYDYSTQWGFAGP